VTQPLARGRRHLVLAICCLSLLIVGMDNTIVNVALPSIAVAFHGDVADLQWVIDAYTVTLAALLILAGSTADRLGRKRTFQTGLVVFTVGSLLCSFAPGLGWLVGFRMVQAVGGCMLNPVAMSIITNVFTDPRERSRAIGVWGGVVGLSLGIGPIVGGALTDSIGWRSIFWINAPIGLMALALTAVFIPESRAAHARRIDPVGQILVVALLATLTYAIIESPRAGWSSATVRTSLAIALLAAVALGCYEPRRPEPLIEFRFFRSLPFSGATLTGVFAFGAYSGFLFLSTLYLQDVRGLSPLHAGLLTTPMAVMVVVAAPVSGRLVANSGARRPLVCAGGAMMGGAAMLLDLSPTTGYPQLIAGFTVFAVGFGLVNPPITNTAVSGMPRSQAGVAAAFASTSRQVGAALGVAVIGAILNAGADAAPAAGIVGHARAAEAVVLGCGLAVALVGLASTTPAARRSAVRTAAALGDAGVEDRPVPTRVPG
jgi:EmrB/QacA subfamily drug resistance transporter